MLHLDAPFERTIRVAASPREVYAVVADVPDSVAHFPDVESLVPHDGGYLWTLRKAGVGRFSMQLVYGCRYTTDADRLHVSWTPIAALGNADVSGHWTIEPDGSGTRLTLDNRLVLRVDAPRVIRRPATAVLQRENTARLITYLGQLQQTFDGGDGRLGAAR